MAGVTLVKICGLTSVTDARLATGLGAWALGFVFTRSPRRVDPVAAAAIIAAARGEKRAGGGAEPIMQAPHAIAVVATEPAEWIAAALEESGADGVQLSAGAHGSPVADVLKAAARLRRRPLVIAAADTPDAHLADYLLLDARTSSAYGGTGETLDWAAIAAAQSTPPRNLVLAGGLRPDNGGTPIAALRPAVVDVSSGVEGLPGVKDPTRLRDFFAAVVQADRGMPRRRTTA
jgi:phosphoribosylanthranilate isomerase